MGVYAGAISAIASVAGAGASIYGASKAGKGASAGLKLTDAQTKRLKSSINSTVKDMEKIMERSAGDMQGEALGANLSAFPSIDKLMTKFTTSQLARTQQGMPIFLKLLSDVADRNGVSVPEIMGTLYRGGAASTRDAQFLSDRGHSLIDGQWYQSPSGRQAQNELLRTMAPGLSTAGVDQITRTLAGSSSKGEVDQITGFLRNAEEKARYGDTLLDTSARLREIGLGRLGSVLAEVSNQAQFVASNSNDAASKGTAVGAGQLIDQQSVANWEGAKLQTLGNVLQMNMGALTGLGNTAANFYSAGQQARANQTQAYANAGATVSRAAMDYAYLRQNQTTQNYYQQFGAGSGYQGPGNYSSNGTYTPLNAK